MDISKQSNSTDPKNFKNRLLFLTKRLEEALNSEIPSFFNRGRKNEMHIYRLIGSTDPENLKNRLSFLTKSFDSAENREIHINTMRQKNLNFALAAFAGLFTFGISLPTELLKLAASLSLFSIMLVFCLLDRRFHKTSHGWRETLINVEDKINEVINNPSSDIEFPLFDVNGEKEAEWMSLQPVIYYLLLIVGFLHFLYSLSNYVRHL